MNDRLLPPRSSDTKQVNAQTDPVTKDEKCLENKDGRVRGISDEVVFEKTIF